MPFLVHSHIHEKSFLIQLLMFMAVKFGLHHCKGPLLTNILLLVHQNPQGLFPVPWVPSLQWCRGLSRVCSAHSCRCSRHLSRNMGSSAPNIPPGWCYPQSCNFQMPGTLRHPASEMALGVLGYVWVFKDFQDEQAPDAICIFPEDERQCREPLRNKIDFAWENISC